MNLLLLQRLCSCRIRFGRFGVGAALALAGLSFAGCASHSTGRQVELFVQTAPVPRLVPAHLILVTAHRAAAAHEGDFVLQGLGHSMEPVYLPGTAVVVHPTAMHMLRPGMAVVYRNPQGNYVGHMLWQKREGGWLAKGLNNADADGVLVTAKNLVGIVRQAFAADDAVFSPVVAQQIATRAALERSPSLALVH